MNERQRTLLTDYFLAKKACISDLYVDVKANICIEEYKYFIQTVNNYVFNLARGEGEYQVAYIQDALRSKGLVISEEIISRAQDALFSFSQLGGKPEEVISNLGLVDYRDSGVEAEQKAEDSLLDEVNFFVNEQSVSLLKIGKVAKVCDRNSLPEQRARSADASTITSEALQRKVDCYVWPRVKKLIAYRQSSPVENMAEIIVEAICDNMHKKSQGGFIKLEYEDAIEVNDALKELWQISHQPELLADPHLGLGRGVKELAYDKALAFASVDKDGMLLYMRSYTKQNQRDNAPNAMQKVSDEKGGYAK